MKYVKLRKHCVIVNYVVSRHVSEDTTSYVNISQLLLQYKGLTVLRDHASLFHDEATPRKLKEAVVKLLSLRVIDTQQDTPIYSLRYYHL